MSRLFRSAIAAVALTALAAASQSLAQPSSNAAARPTYSSLSSGSYRIAGVLVNAITGEPVRRATVAVLATEDNHTIESVVSDNDGRFSLERLPAAKYQLTASKRGFRTGFYDEHDEFSSAIVTGAEQDTSHLNFRLTPGAVLRGFISSDGGDPVEGARVMLFQRPKNHGFGDRMAQAGATVTDDSGAYEFGDLMAGEYQLAVSAEPWYALHGNQSGGQAKSASTSNPALDVAFPVTYYDSTTDEAAATPIILTAGSRVEANISMHAVPALHLSIQTPTKPDGSIARPELQQTVFGNMAYAVSSGFLDAIQSRTVEMSGIAPGHYQLVQGDPPRIVDLDLSANSQVDPNSGAPASAIVGTLQMASGLAPPEEVNLTLNRVDNVPGQHVVVTVANKGRFKFDSVPGGSWTLWAVNGSKALPVVATASGGHQQPGNSLTMHDRPLNLAVTLSDSETRIEGFARKDQKGVAGAMIVLAPRNKAAWQALIRRDQSDSDGSFALRDVAPGEYIVVAIQFGWSLDWSRPEALAHYLSSGTAVTVTANSGTVVRLPSPIAVQMR
jgi:5-hydroxyisourate hydrolase-like protein (transthyretin family)